MEPLSFHVARPSRLCPSYYLCIVLTLTTPLLTAGCGSDTPGNAGTTDVVNAADGGVTDGEVAGEDGQTASDVSGEDDTTTTSDTLTAADGAANDAAQNDTTEEDTQSVTDVSGLDSTGADTTAADAGEVMFSCKGTPSCKLYQEPGGMSSCAKDPGCTPTGYKCAPLNPNAAAICASQKNNKVGCTQAEKAGAGCKWGAMGCYLLNWCNIHKSGKACSGEKNLACAWQPTTCNGVSKLVTCDTAKTKTECDQGAKFGCNWNDCQPTNGGQETCDGVDNNCDGVTDNATTQQGGICDDGDVCNGAEVCIKGKCAAGMGYKCQPKPCHDVACVKGKGCVYTPNTAPCSDNNACTDKDACAAGTCTGGTAKSCDDGDKCTADSCDPKTGTCANKADGVGACDDNNPCTDDNCDPKTGCTNSPNTKPCSDGDACTGGGGKATKGKAVGPVTGDICAAGKCVPGPKVVCNDGNACTDDSCDKLKGCLKLNNAIPCDDKNACTSGEACKVGVCGGGKTKCNDNKICTADSCDAKTGACKNTAIVGCKACTSAANCNDSNNCTKDACTAGKCTHTQIKGCIGPTDYSVVSLVPKVTPIPLPGGMIWNLTVNNSGKAYGGSFTGKMTYQLLLSVDNKVDSGDKLLYGNKWSGYNISTPKAPKATIQIALSVQDPALVAGKKFICVKLAGGGDKNVTNNTMCIPLKVILPDFTAVSLKVFNNPAKANSQVYMAFSFKNNGTKATYTYADFFASKDNKLDASDMLTHGFYKLGATTPGQTKEFKYNKVTILKNVQEDRKYICMRLNTQSDAWKKESNPNDNTICAPIKISNPPNLTLNPVHVAFRDKANKNWANVPYGGTYTCYMTQIANSTFGDAPGGWPVRCWLSDTGKTSFGGDWAVQDKHMTPITGGKVAKTVIGKEYKKLAPTKVGVKYLCADMNHDKSIVESSYSNKVCRKISVLGVDMFVDAGKSKIGAASWKHGQPSTIKRGVGLSVEFVYCNQGNQTLLAKAKGLEARMLLSKDKIPSADDHVIWKTSKFEFSALGGLNKYGKPGCGMPAFNTPKHTLPMTMTPGMYYLLMDVNHDGKHVEPMANNLVVKTLTVQ